MTRLIVGLGNPGNEYAETRHNAGFRVVDAIGDDLRATYWKDRCGAKVAEVAFNGEKLVLAKPQSFMNLSGGPVKRLMDEYGLVSTDILIVHDELDLPAGDVRVKRDGGHAGHNGLRSIHEKLGGGAYPRVRIGIGRPPGRMPVADFVLQQLRGDEKDTFETAIGLGRDAALHVVAHGVDSAMCEYNGEKPSGKKQ